MAKFAGPCALAVLVSTLCVACSTPEKPAPAMAKSVILGAGQHSITLSAQDSGADIVLGRGQELIVRLAVVPTAGLEWTLAEPPSGVLTVQGSRFERAPRDADAIEASGFMVWRFASASAGQVGLRFDLRRPHSLVPASQTVSYAIRVE